MARRAEQTTSEPQAQQQTNGQGDVAQTAPTGPRVPRREQWVDLPEEYPGFRLRLWLNYPQRLKQDIISLEPDRTLPALAQVALEHNGWCNEDGTPFPPAASDDFYQAIPDELAAVVAYLVLNVGQHLPNSLRARRPA